MPATRAVVGPLLTAAVLVLSLVLLATPAHGGSGPETTVVIANADDPASVRVANAYARGRGIPPGHVLYLAGVPEAPVVDVATFRERILGPIEAWLAAEGLALHAEVVAYSTGFPYAVDFAAEAKAKGVAIEPPLSHHASLTGLTYLYRHVLAQDPAAYLSMTANRYHRADARGGGPLGRAPTPQEAAQIRDYQGAIGSKDYRRAEEVLRGLVEAFPGAAALHYDLACCLALNGKRAEALDELARAVETGFDDANHAAYDPDLERLRTDPRFTELLDAMRRAARAPVAPGRAFAADAAWGEDGEPVPDPASPHRYRLAVMLGWTGDHGTTVDEVLACLQRSRACDATAPDGTVYLMVNEDVRARTRAGVFPAVKDALERIGRKAAILTAGQDGQDGILPRGRKDVIGLVAGTAGFQWDPAQATLLPGAIAEHLTSFGAHFGTPGQTKCTEFLRHGAAGTAGTVAEPYAIPHKFPSPWVHLHYARGCSLAEAFYLGLWGPYQLLVLGDPLARPYAQFASVRITAPAPGSPCTGVTDVVATVETAPGTKVARLELWVDGRRSATAEPGQPLPWDTGTAADGVHDVRVVAVEASPIATRSYAGVLLTVVSGGPTLAVDAPASPAAIGSSLLLAGHGEGLAHVAVLRGSQVLAEGPAAGTAWRLDVPTAPLGLGWTTLLVRGRSGDGREVLAAPLDVEVGPPTRLLAARVLEEGLLRPGLLAVATDASGKEHRGVVGTLGRGPGRTLAHDLVALGVPQPSRLALAGAFRSAAGLAELRVEVPGSVRLVVDGTAVLEADGPPPAGRHRVGLALAEGWHELVLEVAGSGIEQLLVTLGGVRSAAPLAGGDLALLPGPRSRAHAPETVTLGERGKEAPALVDGARVGAALDVGDEGVVLTWKKAEAGVVAVVLHNARGGDAPPGPEAWVVETRASAKGRWKAVKDAQTLRAPPPEPPADGKVPPPAWVEVAFDKTSAREIRIRPAEPGGQARLAEIDVLVTAKRR